MRSHVPKRTCSFGRTMPITGTMMAVRTNVRNGMGHPSVSGKATGISTLING